MSLREEAIRAKRIHDEEQAAIKRRIEEERRLHERAKQIERTGWLRQWLASYGIELDPRAVMHREHSTRAVVEGVQFTVWQDKRLGVWIPDPERGGEYSHRDSMKTIWMHDLDYPPLAEVGELYAWLASREEEA